MYHINGKILAQSHTANFGGAGCALAMTQKQQSVSTGVQKLLLCVTVVCNHLRLTEQAKQTVDKSGLLTPVLKSIPPGCVSGAYCFLLKSVGITVV